MCHIIYIFYFWNGREVVLNIIFLYIESIEFDQGNNHHLYVSHTVSFGDGSETGRREQER